MWSLVCMHGCALFKHNLLFQVHMFVCDTTWHTPPCLFLFISVPIQSCSHFKSPLSDIIPCALTFEMEINHAGEYPEGKPVIYKIELLAQCFTTEIQG